MGAYRIKDAAKILSVSESTVRKMCADKELQSFRVGAKNVRITKKALHDYVRKQGGGDLFMELVAGPSAEPEQTEQPAQPELSM
jgi:excisionase family DNA binding protein